MAAGGSVAAEVSAAEEPAEDRNIFSCAEKPKKLCNPEPPSHLYCRRNGREQRVREPHDISPEHEAKGFCAICKNGGTQKTASPDTREIVDFTKGTDFAWIDYGVEDIEQDVKNTAQILQAGWRCPIPFTKTCFRS